MGQMVMLTTQQLALLQIKVKAVATRAGSFIIKEQLAFRQAEVERKGHNDLVSYVDRTAEQMIVTGLSTLLPEAGFVTEEGTAGNTGQPLQWVIDPLDGTTNFVHGMPFFAVSIALVQNHIPVLGVVYELGRMEMFSASLGNGATMNGEPITVSKTAELKDSLLGTGFPYTDFGQVDAYLALFRELMQTSRGLRRPGSAATDLAYVACGRFDGFFEYGLSPWDVAAGICLVTEAGGTVTDFTNGPNAIANRQIVATNGLTHEALRSTVERYMISH